MPSSISNHAICLSTISNSVKSPSTISKFVTSPPTLSYMFFTLVDIKLCDLPWALSKTMTYTFTFTNTIG